MKINVNSRGSFRLSPRRGVTFTLILDGARLCNHTKRERVLWTYIDVTAIFSASHELILAAASDVPNSFRILNVQRNIQNAWKIWLQKSLFVLCFVYIRRIFVVWYANTLIFTEMAVITIDWMWFSESKTDNYFEYHMSIMWTPEP